MGEAGFRGLPWIEAQYSGLEQLSACSCSYSFAVPDMGWGRLDNRNSSGLGRQGKGL